MHDWRRRIPLANWRVNPWMMVALGVFTLWAAILQGHPVDPSLGPEHLSVPALASSNSGSSTAEGSKSERSGHTRLVAAYGKLPLRFEVNRGQVDGRVKFLSRGRGYTLFLTADEAVLALRGARQESEGKNQKAKAGNVALRSLLSPVTREGFSSTLRSPVAELENNSARVGEKPRGQTTDLEQPRGQRTDAALQALVGDPKSRIENGHSLALSSQPLVPSVVRLKLVGANPRARVVGLEELPGKANYFVGNDPAKWRIKVPTYAGVKYEQVWPGIDLVYHGEKSEVGSQKAEGTEAAVRAGRGQLEFDFVVHAGADPGAIRLEIVGAGLALPSGAQQAAPVGMHTPVAAVSDRRPAMGNRRGDPLQIDSNGDLVIATEAGEIRFRKPVVYQPVTSHVAAGLSRQATGGGLKPPLQPSTDNPKSQIQNRQFLDGRYVLFTVN